MLYHNYYWYLSNPGEFALIWSIYRKSNSIKAATSRPNSWKSNSSKSNRLLHLIMQAAHDSGRSWSLGDSYPSNGIQLPSSSLHQPWPFLETSSPCIHSSQLRMLQDWTPQAASCSSLAIDQTSTTISAHHGRHRIYPYGRLSFITVKSSIWAGMTSSRWSLYSAFSSLACWSFLAFAALIWLENATGSGDLCLSWYPLVAEYPLFIRPWPECLGSWVAPAEALTSNQLQDQRAVWLYRSRIHYPASS